MQSSPWLLSDNFVSSMVDKKGHMALVGPGDPTGKGRGFSFTKDPRRVSLAQTSDISARCQQGF